MLLNAINIAGLRMRSLVVWLPLQIQQHQVDIPCLGVSGRWRSTIKHPFLKSQSQGMPTNAHLIDVCVRHGDSRPQCSVGLILLVHLKHS